VFSGKLVLAKLCLSGGAFLCGLLFSRQQNAIASNVAAQCAWHVWTMTAWMLSDGSRVAARVSSRENVFAKAFCGALRGLF
jgi:hypothetical protein